jgi:predicted dinucleotide-binding enzyme
MKIGILGTGDVGKALGRGFLAAGHEVKMGARQAGSEKATAWVKESGARASEGSFVDAAKFGEVVVLATLGVANEGVLAQAGAENLKGKVVIDATNPLDFSKGFPPSLAISGRDSGGEQAQRLLPGAHVVKCFNTIGNAHMYKPAFPGGPPDMFIAGNDAGAKAKVGEILRDFGWNTVDLGGIESSRYLEAMCMAWVLTASGSGNWNIAFKLLRKG